MLSLSSSPQVKCNKLPPSSLFLLQPSHGNYMSTKESTSLIGLLLLNVCQSVVQCRVFFETSLLIRVGHATLGTAYILFVKERSKAKKLTFKTVAGDLFATLKANVRVHFPVFMFLSFPLSFTLLLPLPYLSPPLSHRHRIGLKWISHKP